MQGVFVHIIENFSLVKPVVGGLAMSLSSVSPVTNALLAPVKNIGERCSANDELTIYSGS
jgi:hypothetical protein